MDDGKVVYIRLNYFAWLSRPDSNKFYITFYNVTTDLDRGYCIKFFVFKNVHTYILCCVYALLNCNDRRAVGFALFCYRRHIANTMRCAFV